MRSGMPVAGMKLLGRSREVDVEEDGEVRQIRTTGASLIDGPSHVGSRRHAEIDKDKPFADEPETGTG